jgi:hypothetical protein
MMTTMMITTTNNTTTNTNITNTTAAQQQQPHTMLRPKWVRAQKTQEKRLGARLILEAAGLLRRVGATAAGAKGGRNNNNNNDMWGYHMALDTRLREPSVVAAARRLFPSFIGRAMRQHPDTVVAGFVYEPSALLGSFLLSQHRRRFGVASSLRAG